MTAYLHRWEPLPQFLPEKSIVPPRSPNGYANFTGRVCVGFAPMTKKAADGRRSLPFGFADAVAHYEAGECIAMIRCWDDDEGIAYEVLAGSVDAWALGGDWREVDGHLELVAVGAWRRIASGPLEVVE